MCMFTYANTSSAIARVKGVEKFECGACPECLQKKSRKWALRCGMQAKVSPGVMVTLTYDSYKYGSTTEENPTDPTIPLSKKHCQDFLKRLRKWLSKRSNKKLYYLLTAERGKRTNRAHYHALLFNVTFDDLIKYKRSKRGNIIYKSQTLERLWTHGICTVDCINLSAKTARYCTKYCAKDSGVNDTFMLFSRGIGDEELLKWFNGKSYWVDGREYSIPREIWQKYIENKYKIFGYSRYRGVEHLEKMERKLCGQLDKLESLTMAVLLKKDNWRLKFNKARREKKRKMTNYCRRMLYKYTQILKIAKKNTFSRCNFIVDNFENSPIEYYRQAEMRDIYTVVRDNDPLYQSYLDYWAHKNEVANLTRPDELSRIQALPDNKYWSYKQKAIRAKARQYSNKRLHFTPPRSNCSGFELSSNRQPFVDKSFAPLSRHYTANDTARAQNAPIFKRLFKIKAQIMRANAKRSDLHPF